MRITQDREIRGERKAAEQLEIQVALSQESGSQRKDVTNIEYVTIVSTPNGSIMWNENFHK